VQVASASISFERMKISDIERREFLADPSLRDGRSTMYLNRMNSVSKIINDDPKLKSIFGGTL